MSADVDDQLAGHNSGREASMSGGQLALTGTYAADNYSINMSMQGSDGEVVRMRVDAKRLGDCAG